MSNPAVARRPGGFTLIELMVAMLLGLIVIGGVTSVFLAGQQTYRANEALSDVADGSRTAFELLSRDLRGAGLTGCDTTNGRVANVINPDKTTGVIPWYADWNNALHGYDDATQDPALTGITGAGAPVAGTSSVHILSTANTDVSVSWTPAPTAANFKVTAQTTQLSKGDLIMVCDFDHASILQITGYNSSNITVEHNPGNPVSPGNCAKGLGYPSLCDGANGNPYTFPGNSRVAKLTAVVWYIGTNSVNGKSLYRLRPTTNSTGVVTTPPSPQEMVRNVTNMQIAYLQPGAGSPGTGFVNAAGITNWATVDSAQVQLEVTSTNQRAGVNQKPIVRNFTSTTTVRNRAP